MLYETLGSNSPVVKLQLQLKIHFTAASLNVGLLFRVSSTCTSIRLSSCSLRSPELTRVPSVAAAAAASSPAPLWPEPCLPPSRPGPAANLDVEEAATLPAATSALEEMALYSNKRKLRQGRRSLETAVPT